MARTKRSTRKAAPSSRLVATAATLRSAFVSRAGIARELAASTLSQVERALQLRASSVAAKLGIPRAAEVRALTRQVAQLQQNVEQLRRARARA